MFLIGALFFLLGVLSRIGAFPDAAAILAVIGPYSDRYGLPFVFACYFIEGLFVVNFYWPGSFIAFVAIVTYPHNPYDLAMIWIALNLAACLSLAVNVLLGRHGGYKVLLRCWHGDGFRTFSLFARRFGLWGLTGLGFHINWLALGVVALSSTRAMSGFRVWSVATLSHAFWSIPVIILLSWIGLPSPAGGNSDYMLAAAMVGLGIMVCGFKDVLPRLSFWRKLRRLIDGPDAAPTSTTAPPAA